MAKRKRNLDPNLIWLVTFWGKYHAMSDVGRVSKGFELTVKIVQSELEKDTNPQSLFLNNLAGRYMPRKYGDYVSPHKYWVKRAVPLGEFDVTDLRLMSKDQMLGYIASEELPVDPLLYENTDILRAAIQSCEENEETFLKVQTKLKETRGKTLVTSNVLALLNDDDFDELNDIDPEQAKGPVLTKPFKPDLQEMLNKQTPLTVAERKDLVGFSDDAPPPGMFSGGIANGAVASYEQADI